MKTRSLISCILLSIFIILLLSMGAQATEYKEVNASNITEHIENGEDVNLTDCRVVGELNVSKINLETVPNPNFDKLLKKGYTREEITSHSGFKENLSVIKSNIIITNSIFEKDLDFSNVLFNNSVNFTGVIFNGSAYFRWATFNGSTDFRWATFKNSAYFEQVTFNNSVNFTGVIFNGSTDFPGVTFNNSVNFTGAKFNNSADFTGAKFNNSARFTGVIFNGSAYFRWATFNGSTDFRWATFKNSAYFEQVTFNNSADFFWVTFKNSAYFQLVTFNNSADFQLVTFNNSADFTGAKFNNSARFSWATFNGSTDFRFATFNNSAYFEQVTFNNSADFQVPDTSENIFTDGKMCTLFMKSYNDESRYTDANNIYYNYRKIYQNNKDLTDPSKWIDVLSWITCGYGTRISHTLIFSVGIIISFACLYRQSTTVSVINSKNKRKTVKVYWEEPKIYKLSDATEKRSIISFFDALYFSLMIFTTLGSEWNPRDNYRKWVALEGVLGYIMLGIFLSTIGNMLIKP